jgi:capsular exopolysaccharide synthesis family protein
LIAGVAIAITTTVGVRTLLQTPIYQAEFRVLVGSVTNTNTSQQLLQADQPVQLQSDFDYSTQIEVLRSPELLQLVVKNLQKTYPDISYSSLVENLTISRLQETKILSVSYRDPDPVKIKAVLDQVSKVYLNYSFQERQTSLSKGVQFVEEQLPELRQRVNNLEISLEKFRQRYSLVDPESRGGQLSEFINAIEKQQQEAQTQLTEAQSLYTLLERQLGYRPGQALAASALSESPRYQQLLNRIQEVETQIAVESARFTPNSPNIQALLDKRQNLIPMLNQEAQRILGSNPPPGANGNLTAIPLDLVRQLVNTANQVQVLQVRTQSLTQAEAILKQNFALIPALARQYTNLQRELKVANDSLNRFLTTRETLEIEAAQKAIPWQLISSTQQPQVPISPNIQRNFMIGAIAGLLLGVGAALLAERLNNVFHSPDDIKDSTRLPLLGIIPFNKKLQQLPAAGAIGYLPQAETGQLFGSKRNANQYSASPFLEAFRTLHTNIRLLSSDSPIRSLVISSAVPAEGKSTIATHLAYAAAAMGQRVLLVDADLRRPQVHTRLGLPNLRGLSNAIFSDLNLRSVIQRSPTEENLYVLTAGQLPPDPTKLLSSNKMQHLMERVQAVFDLVIYDAPPFLGLADGSLLATHSDGIVLVVGLGETDRTIVTQALDQLRTASVPVLGIVANGVKAHIANSYDSYYHNHYYSRDRNQKQLGEEHLSQEVERQ